MLEKLSRALMVGDASEALKHISVGPIVSSKFKGELSAGNSARVNGDTRILVEAVLRLNLDRFYNRNGRKFKNSIPQLT